MSFVCRAQELSGAFDQTLFQSGIFRLIGVNTLATLGAGGTSTATESVRVDLHAATYFRALRASR